MKDFFNKTKKYIAPFLSTYLNEQAATHRLVNKWASDTLKRLDTTAVRGKMVRGGLVYAAYSLAHKPYDKTCLKIAAAMEIVHTALVIHDDIMDGDGMRRGEPTMYKQYQSIAEQNACSHPDQVGTSLGICAGDVAIFLSFNLLSSLPHSHTKLGQQIITTFSKELTRVGFAQMQDVFAGAVPRSTSVADIIKLYLYKTARYTFSLPLMLGGMAAGMKPGTIKKLEKLGEHLGIIFQIKDDELGMWGDEQKIGKPIGSDIREGKKTLYHYFLFTLASPSERAALDLLFGNGNITKDELLYVHNLINTYGIAKKINHYLKKEVSAAQKIISVLPFKIEQKKVLLELLAFNLNRVT